MGYFFIHKAFDLIKAFPFICPLFGEFQQDCLISADLLCIDDSHIQSGKIFQRGGCTANSAAEQRGGTDDDS